MTAAFQRVLLILERANQGAEVALHTATELAVRHGTPLLGLYVEDLNLLRSAALPGSTEIRLSTAMSSPLSDRLLERQLDDEARRLRQLVEAARRRTLQSLSCSLEVRRGVLAEEVRQTILPGDLVIVDRSPYRPVFPAARGAVQAALAVSTPFTLLLTLGQASEGRLAVLVDAPDSEIEALVTAASALARDDHSSIVVFLAVPESQRANAQARATATATRLARPIEYRSVDPMRPVDLERKLGRFHGRALVLNRASPFIASKAGQRFLQSVHVPLYLVTVTGASES